MSTSSKAGLGGVTAETPDLPGTLLDFVVLVADERMSKAGGDVIGGEGSGGDVIGREETDGAGGPITKGGGGTDTRGLPCLCEELSCCAAGGRWSQQDLGAALARIDAGLEAVRAEAKAAAAAAAEGRSVGVSPEEPLAGASASEGGAGGAGGGGGGGGGGSEERRCAEALQAFVAGADERRALLRAAAAAVDDQYRGLCAYVGEGGAGGAGQMLLATSSNVYFQPRFLTQTQCRRDRSRLYTRNRGSIHPGSRPGRTVGESVGGILKMDSSDLSNGIRYHIIDTRPDTEFKWLPMT